MAAKLSDAFEVGFKNSLEVLFSEVHQRGDGRAHLAAIASAVWRLRDSLQAVKSRGADDLRDRLEDLEYPLAKLKAFFEGAPGALERRATEIMARYLEDRMKEIRLLAKSLDKGRDPHRTVTDQQILRRP